MTEGNWLANQFKKENMGLTGQAFPTLNQIKEGIIEGAQEECADEDHQHTEE